MKAFLSIKFWGDDRNKDDVEAVIDAIETADFSVFCFRRDAEDWGKNEFSPEEMMRRTFKEIEKSDVLVANVAHWPIGVGVESGYANEKGIPIICIYPADATLANTVGGIARHIIKYKSYDDLRKQLTSIKDQ